MHRGAPAPDSCSYTPANLAKPVVATPHHWSTMPSALPDPVLALSMDNVLKLNDLNLDQLANLWNGEPTLLVRWLCAPRASP
jgi:hypothetical protein